MDGRTHCRRRGNEMGEAESNNRHCRAVGTRYQRDSNSEMNDLIS
jgi:hypothetical protein